MRDTAAMQRLLLPLLLVASSFGCRVVNAAEASAPPNAIQWTSATIPWGPGPATLPAGTRSAVLEGNPREPGMFTMRLEVPAGALVPPHTHPRPERVTMISGAVGVGFGSTVSDDVTVFHAGDFYVNPANEPHFVRFVETSVIQITGEGPWELRRVE